MYVMAVCENKSGSYRYFPRQKASFWRQFNCWLPRTLSISAIKHAREKLSVLSSAYSIRRSSLRQTSLHAFAVFQWDPWSFVHFRYIIFMKRFALGWHIYVGLSLELRTRNCSSFELAIVSYNRDYTYRYKNDFYKVNV